MRVLVQRTAMIGGGLAYNLLVPIEDIPHYNPVDYTTICQDGGKFWDFEYAMLSAKHMAMPAGIERWKLWEAHEAAIDLIAYQIAVQVFPELSKIGTLPKLWAIGLLDNEPETSKDIWVNYEDQTCTNQTEEITS